MTEFKAGDRVEVLHNLTAALGSEVAPRKGEILTIAAISRNGGIEFDRDGKRLSGGGWLAHNFKAVPADPIPATPEKTQTPALVLEVGKAYRARNGERVTIFDQRCESRGYIAGRDQRGPVWYQVDGGKFYDGSCPDLDLIAEWSDEPAATPTLDRMEADPAPDFPGLKRIREIRESNSGMTSRDQNPPAALPHFNQATPFHAKYWDGYVVKRG